MEARELGVMLAKRRDALQLSQADLAEMAGLTVKTLYLIEKGLGNPSFQTLKKLLDLLGLSLQIDIKKISE